MVKMLPPTCMSVCLNICLYICPWMLNLYWNVWYLHDRVHSHYANAWGQAFSDIIINHVVTLTLKLWPGWSSADVVFCEHILFLNNFWPLFPFFASLQNKMYCCYEDYLNWHIRNVFFSRNSFHMSDFHFHCYFWSKNSLTLTTCIWTLTKTSLSCFFSACVLYICQI